MNKEEIRKKIESLNEYAKQKKILKVFGYKRSEDPYEEPEPIEEMEEITLDDCKTFAENYFKYGTFEKKDYELGNDDFSLLKNCPQKILQLEEIRWEAKQYRFRVKEVKEKVKERNKPYENTYVKYDTYDRDVYREEKESEDSMNPY